MITNPEKLQRFNEERIRQDKTDPAARLRIFEALWREAVAVGAMPLKDPLEGIEVDIRIARILNHV